MARDTNYAIFDPEVNGYVPRHTFQTEADVSGEQFLYDEQDDAGESIHDLFQQAQTGAIDLDTDRVRRFSVHEVRTKKVAEAQDYITEQAGFDQFAADGGGPRPDISAEDLLEERHEEYYAGQMHELAMAMDHYSDDSEKLEELEQRRREILAEDPMRNAAAYM